MVLRNCSIATCGLFLLLGGAAASAAAPNLNLTLSLVSPAYSPGGTSFTIPIVPGSNGPTQIVDAFNIGDGSLKVTATSSVPWLVPTVDAQSFCSLRGACIPVEIALQTSSLTAGTYTGTVTIADSNALNAPQFVMVTAQVGGDVPEKLEFFLPPGGTASQDFITATPVRATIQPASPWLAIGVDGQGTFHINVPYKVTVKAASNMAAGDSNATITLTGSGFAPDNKAIMVVLHVTTQPIVETSAATVSLTGVQGAAKQTATIAISNGGQGTLTVSGVTATPASGTWLTAQSVNSGAAVTITADPTSLMPNTYPGTVTIASNAANSSVTIPVQFNVEAQTPPVAFAGGAVNNGTFAAGEPLALGDIAAVFGDQFTLGALAYPSGLPLPTTLNGTQVMVNNTPAPLFFISNSQIDFEVPFEVPSGSATVQVVRNGQQGNLIAVNIAPRTPRFILLNGGPYPILNTPDTPPVVTGIPTHPAKVGDVVVAYVIGLGQTNPPIQTATAAPGSPLSNVANVQVCFGQDTPFAKSICITPDFAGAAPGFVGLYQVNAKIPKGLLPGDNPFYFVVAGVASNLAQIAIQ